MVCVVLVQTQTLNLSVSDTPRGEAVTHVLLHNSFFFSVHSPSKQFHWTLETQVNVFNLHPGRGHSCVQKVDLCLFGSGVFVMLVLIQPSIKSTQEVKLEETKDQKPSYTFYCYVAVPPCGWIDSVVKVSV